MSERAGDVGREPLNRGEASQLDLAHVASQLWRHRLSGILVVVLALAASITYLNLATYKYTATLVVVPADQDSSKVSGGLAGLGSLVGVNLAGGEGSAFTFYPEAIKSQAVAEAMARDDHLMKTVFKNDWDPASGKWVNRPSTLRKVAQAVKAALGVPRRPWAPPAADELRLYIEEHLTIVEDKEKSKLTLSLEHADKTFAAYFLNKAYRETDEFLRSNSLARTSAYAEYLERRLNQVTVAEYRESLAESLAAYEKTRMMASSDVSFAAERFGNVWVSPKPTDPAPFLVIFVNLALATILWAVAVLVVLPLIAAARRTDV